jgi:hypothetical protein
MVRISCLPHLGQVRVDSGFMLMIAPVPFWQRPQHGGRQADIISLRDVLSRTDNCLAVWLREFFPECSTPRHDYGHPAEFHLRCD